MSLMDSENIRIINVEPENSQKMQDIERMETAVVLESRPLSERKQGEISVKKEKNYSPFFFLASLFCGIGLTATFEVPIFLFAGLSLGFLFFVDPIYKKIMEKINNF
jgi:hypothetical protein